MRLRREQQERLTHELGIRANEACDKCGKILGAVRYTRRNAPGEWCSRECRDGEAAVQAHEARIARKAGRPLKYRSETARRESVRAQNAARQRAHRVKRSSVTQNWQQPTDNTQVADAIFRSGYTHSQNDAASSLEPLMLGLKSEEKAPCQPSM